MIKYIYAKIFKKIQVAAIKNSEMSKFASVSAQSHLYFSKLDDYSYIGYNSTVIYANIGKFCSIADNVIIGGANHPIDWGSTSPVFHEGRNILNTNFSKHEFNPYKETVIKNDVWIGSNSIIKSGVTVGNGAIVGMGSVVTKDIKDYEVWAGNPAKKIRNRYEDRVIEKLKNYKWWSLDPELLKSVAHDINNVEKFIESLEKL